MAYNREHRLVGVPAVTALADLGFASATSGVIARRRPASGLLERAGAESRVIERVRQLRREFGSGPVELVVLGRRIAVLLDPADIGRVLGGAPTPFHPANREKRHPSRQFQPHGALLSDGPIRAQRRALNEAALDAGAPLHHLATPFAAAIADEARGMIDSALRHGHLDARQFTAHWWQLVRRIVLGERGRDDIVLTDELARLRSAGSWSFLAPARRRQRDQFTDRLYRHVESAPADSLAGTLATAPTGSTADLVGQIPHWLFAFDAAGSALSRTMAVLSTHPQHHARALGDACEPQRVALRSYLRACVLESVRLWPTTPILLRDLTTDTQWRDGDESFTIAAGATLIIALSAFHRDSDLLPFADEFTPDIWLDGRAEQYPQLVPFSAGQTDCPGRNLVLFVTSTLLAHLLTAADFRPRSAASLSPQMPLPVTVNTSGLDFTVEACLSRTR
ncbi:cytochrome P450 [Nocardia sp. 004]|uniref:cytochrome P450 n=1 Tax=Nocardia sp. 004 TaxID=3385978 RepID=UPI00399F8ABF